MKKHFLALAGVALAMTLSTGCYSTIDGSTHGGVAMGKDKIESRYERPTEQVWKAAREVLQRNGTLEGENTISHVIWAKVDTRTVYVKVQEVEPKVTGVTVQVHRKGGGGDVDLAAEIDKQIALQLVR
ncbi:MAG TPA: DUF3568 family protein [Verrucomicrobiae bacterium]|nr:DUF3568 family protein [Verrucomicrobiae bacterium]